jgi:hypothetical protein
MAAKVNLVIDQGTTFTTTFDVSDSSNTAIDFSTYTARSQLRKAYESSISYPFSVALSSNGYITLSMTANTTNVISAGRYVYDVEVQATNGDVLRIVEGIVTITPQVTR